MMSTVVRINQSLDTMSQIVPSAGFTPPYSDYSAFTTDFDLSLLPAFEHESEVTFSPTGLSSFLSFYPTLDDGIVCDSFGFVNDLKCPKTEVKSLEDEPLHTPLKKSTFFNEKMDKKDFDLRFIKKEDEETPLIPTTVQGQFNYPIKEEPLSYMGCSDFNNPMSPPLTSRVPHQSPISLPLSSPCSPATSYSSHSSYHRSLPPSPYTKTEKTVDLQEILKESQMLQSSIRCEPSTSRDFPTLQNLLRKDDEKTDHKLLRSVLRDTSFQKKFNIRSFEIEEGGVDKVKLEGGERKSDEMVEELTRERIEPVLSMAIEQLRKEVDNTCSVLGISPDPSQWTVENVKSWLLWTAQQLALQTISVEYFNMDGAALSQLTEEDFQQRCPQSGSILHAQLEIWKAASYQECSEQNPEYNSAQWSPTMHSSGSSTGDLSDEEDEEMEQTQNQSGLSQQTEQTTTTTTTTPVTKARSSGGSHIHLWQFLKELLASPQVHGSCIRWTDRQKGVFKIEDSVRVARLWGKRKNRPAMNYDKLSRSIRQYYKKGIMKKTERSQRLVYQFCHPYSL